MPTIQFTTTVGEDRVIHLPRDVPFPLGEVEVSVTSKAVAENPRLRALVDRLAGAAAALGVDTSGLPSDLAQNHDHYLHGLPKGTDDA